MFCEENANEKVMLSFFSKNEMVVLCRKDHNIYEWNFL